MGNLFTILSLTISVRGLKRAAAWMMLIFLFTGIQFTDGQQVIPVNRQVKWKGAGIPTTNPVITKQVNVKTFGAKGDSINDDYSAINSAITSLGGYAGIVYFPPGKYLVKSTINLPDSVILRGDCSDSSHLIFNLNGGAVDCIDAIVGPTTTFQNILKGFTIDTTVLEVANASGFNVGDYAEIKETNGAWNVDPATWAIDCVGQIVRITAINGNYITFQNPLRITYTPSLTPQIRKWVPRVFDGIEDLHINRIDTGLPVTGYAIYFKNAMNCWVKGVESRHSVGAHVAIDDCTNITVSGCYFKDSYAYDGNGTRGYGVMLIQHAGQCLVENNVFNHLRHSIIVKQGANGNVAGYNYCVNEYRVEIPTNSGADLACHGHYSFANLFEGNIVNNIMVDSTWGPTGPYTTFYRNRALLYGIIMTSGASVPSDSLNWVGNETTNKSLLKGLFYISGINHFEYGNNILGTITPAGTNNLTDTSYYRSTFTDFFNAPPYPPIVGIPNVLGSGTIPALQRYTAGGKMTVSPNPPCSTKISVIVNNATICKGSSVALTASGATSYTWTPSTGLSATTGASVTANPSITTTYTVTGTSGGSSGSAKSTVTVKTLPVIKVSPTSAKICSAQSVKLSASGGSTYTWSPSLGLSGTSGSLVTASPLVTTTYVVTGKNTGGCSNTASSILTIGCPAPASLISSGLTDSSVTLSWSGPTCATSFKLQYKLHTATTWTSISTTLVSYALKGLAKATAYDWKVSSVCITGTSATSATQSFTTLANRIENFAADQPQLVVYPNPAGNTATIEFTSNETSVQVRLVNILGQTIYWETLTLFAGHDYKKDIDLSKLPAGIYEVVVRTGSEILTKKVVKEN